MSVARAAALVLAVVSGAIVVLGLLPPPSPLAAAVPGGAGPVVGPTFAPWDRTYPAYGTNTGLGFDFRVPRSPTMQCTLTDPENFSDMRWPGEISWSCGEKGSYGAITGIVTASPCEERLCDMERWRRAVEEGVRGEGFMGAAIQDEAKAQGVEGVERADPTTVYYDYTNPSEEQSDGRPRYRLTMFHLWDRGEDSGAPDADIVVVFSGPPEKRAEVQKIVNDIRRSTP